MIMKTSRFLILMLVVMGLATLLLVAAAIFLLTGGTLGGAGLTFAKAGAIHVFVQTPEEAQVGQEARLVVTVTNDTGAYAQVDEIRLPVELLRSAWVAAILPGTLVQTDYEGETGYQIGYLMAPGDRRDFEITLMPQKEDDLVGYVKVRAGEYEAKSGFRLIFKPKAVVQIVDTATLPPTIIPVTPTDTPLPPTPTATPVLIPYEAVVKITAKIKYSSYLRDVWSGSGTLVSPDGLILTNAHLVTPGQGYKPDFWAIGFTSDPALPPEDRYYAEPLVVDTDLDLAVLRIVTDLKYNPVDASALNLPWVKLGDSNALKLGDPLMILGYPGIGGATITLTRGDVGGFTASKKFGERSFIKTSASISGGTSGGMAMDQNGLLVAIPTQLGYGARDEVAVDCRVIADTNGDGDVDNKDVCVPVGGFINAMRPSSLAIPLIEQAGLIIKYSGTPSPYPSPVP
jgi:S1-C subfamily serine protease